MTKLLAIEVSPRGDLSISRRLAADFINVWKAEHPGGVVTVRDLTTTPLPFIDLNWILGVFGTPDQRAPQTAPALALSDELIAELFEADHILIGTPMYNFNIPAVLKAYIDHVVRANVTFNANHEGLVTGKKVTVIMTTASDFAPGAGLEDFNHASGYLRLILGFIGITDVTIVLADRAIAVSRGEVSYDSFRARHEQALRAAAAAA